MIPQHFRSTHDNHSKSRQLNKRVVLNVGGIRHEVKINKREGMLLGHYVSVTQREKNNEISMEPIVKYEQRKEEPTPSMMQYTHCVCNPELYV